MDVLICCIQDIFARCYFRLSTLANRLAQFILICQDTIKKNITLFNKHNYLRIVLNSLSFKFVADNKEEWSKLKIKRDGIFLWIQYYSGKDFIKHQFNFCDNYFSSNMLKNINFLKIFKKWQIRYLWQKKNAYVK